MFGTAVAVPAVPVASPLKIYQDHLIALERQRELECKAREEAEGRKESEKGIKEKV